MPRKPMTDEQKKAMKDGREAAAKKNGGKPAGKRRSRKKLAIEEGRFRCCSNGVVTVFEEDLVHGVTLTRDWAYLLRDFLNRMFPPNEDGYGATSLPPGLPISGKDSPAKDGGLPTAGSP